MNVEQALNEAIRRTNGHEGGFANVDGDAGGKTAVGGLTEKLARDYGYTGPMEAMTLKQSLEIIVEHCWDKPGLMGVASIAPYLAIAMYDCNVNFGPGRAGRWTQEALNALNFNKKYGPDLATDGNFGPASRARYSQVKTERGAEVEDWMVEAIVARRVCHYIDCCLTDPTQRKFGAGWLDRVVDSAGEY